MTAVPEQPAQSSDFEKRRILDAFESMAAVSGPRGVGMSALARELGISTRTLYRHFPAKADLVAALMQLWADTWYEAQHERLQRRLPPQQRIEEAALAWQDHIGRFGPGFWQQLERDFPEAYAIYQHQYLAFLKRSRGNLLQDIRPDLNPGLALSGLMTLMDQANNAGLCEQLDITRRQSLLQTIDLWCRGALTPEAQTRG